MGYLPYPEGKSTEVDVIRCVCSLSARVKVAQEEMGWDGEQGSTQAAGAAGLGALLLLHSSKGILSPHFCEHTCSV